MEIGDFRKCGTHFSESRKFYGCLGIHYRLSILYSRPPVKCSIYLRLGLPRALQLCAWLVFCILPEAFPRMPELKLHLSPGQQVMQCGFSFWVQDKKGWNSYLNFISFFFFFFFFSHLSQAGLNSSFTNCGWPWTSDSPVFIICMWVLQPCATTPGFYVWWFKPRKHTTNGVTGLAPEVSKE